MNRHQLQTLNWTHQKEKAVHFALLLQRELGSGVAGSLIMLWAKQQDRRNLFLSYWQKSVIFCSVNKTHRAFCGDERFSSSDSIIQTGAQN